MGYKKWGKEISFMDLAVSKSLEHNRSLMMMKSIEKVVKWRDGVHGEDKEHPGCDVKANGIQPISWIESDSEGQREVSARGMAFGYAELCKIPSGLGLGSKKI